MRDHHLRTARPIWLIFLLFFCVCNCQDKVCMKENFPPEKSEICFLMETMEIVLSNIEL